ncbi:hypothetical protein [Bradyrhizobium australiense]|uniref:Uncharacterized protein n=1 Tax=Bradyrhizobium australiense TaxID=2721161 RepID=A0A7Y4GYZ9_9BRAD|nr:hypothetical protein [Bradyrhizobium australiense]NOJ44604.1 hypothetical protein [Bradyrhizobium australiense]
MTKSDRQIMQWVEETPFVGTHEHLNEESQRISSVLGSGSQTYADWTYLFNHYVSTDLLVAGMPAADLQSFLGSDLSSDAKYRLVAPHWDRIRHTDYAQAVRHSLRGLYGEDDLTAESVPRIAAKYRETVQAGFYAAVLRRANVEVSQVNSLQRIFMKPSSRRYSHRISAFSNFAAAVLLIFFHVEAETGKRAATLEEWLDIIDFYFATYGPGAVSVKCQIAYSRALDFHPVTRAQASRFISASRRPARTPAWF